MKPAKAAVGIWVVTGLLAALMVGGLARPMWVAWRCVAQHSDGEQAFAEVVGKEPGIGITLQVTSGSQAGQACLVKESESNPDAIALGQRLEVVLPYGRPGRCSLLATVEASQALLTSLTATSVALLLGLLLTALVIQRNVTRAPELTTRMDLGAEAIRCPRCEKPMSEGYLPMLAGLHWRRNGEPIGLPHALSGLPGTFGWRGRPSLHAWRCEPCEVITLRYGKPDPKR